MRVRRTLGVAIAVLIVFAGGMVAGTFWLGPFVRQVVGAGESETMAQRGAQAQPEPAEGKKVLYWKSPMIPGEIHAEPGKDSMGMDLVPVYEGEAPGPGQIEIAPMTEQNMGVRVQDVKQGPLVKSVRTVGYVDYDETSLATVTTKVDGWIEKLWVDETGAQVHEGDRLFDLYSPALYAAQQGYLAALRGVQKEDVPAVPRSLTDSKALVEDARTRLEYFDVSAAQIDELRETGTIRKTVTMHSPFTGIVVHKSVVEGEKVHAGADLLRLADLSSIWVMGRVYEYDLPYVHEGQEALMTLSYLPGKTFRGRVAYVYPFLEEGTREITVRMEFHNPSYELKPGMYATVSLRTEVDSDATLVPDTAVIDTGTRTVAFVKTAPGRFEMRELATGLRGEGHVLQVLSGLSPGEQVVVSGEFLIDSESRLRESAMKFLAPGKQDAESNAPPEQEAPEQEKPGQEKPGQAGDAETPAVKKFGADGELRYVCPMPEHASILYDAPGSCPLCDKTMKLVPLRERKGDEGRELRVLYWTCPMPEHASVHEARPGKCPMCGMTLVPVHAGSEARKER